MQQYPLLQTKLYFPPIRPGLVLRPRLIGRLNEGMTRKLTLISAPAGFGKTTLVSEWIAGCERPAAWLSLDGGDNDPARFLTYLVTALQTIESDLGQGIWAALKSPGALNVEAILTTLINEIVHLPGDPSPGSERGLVLILDDYHVVESQPLDDVLTFLLEHLPPQMHLVIATREDPFLPLARRRGRSQLTELRAFDLHFSPSEAAQFLNEVMGLDLSTDDITALETRTEGWIAGLQLV